MKISNYWVTHITLSICLIFGLDNLYGQIPESQKQYISDSSFVIVPSKAIANLRKGDDNWIEDNPITSDMIPPFESSFYMDAFTYFKVSDIFSDSQIDSLLKTDYFAGISNYEDFKEKKIGFIFDSELKKTVYKQSSAYKELLNRLAIIKQKYLNEVFYFFGSDIDNIERFNSEIDDVGDHRYKINYDLKSGGFYIRINEIRVSDCNYPNLPKTINKIEFSQLIVHKRHFTYDRNTYNMFKHPDGHGYIEYIFIPVDIESALEMESNRESIEIIFIFNINEIGLSTIADIDYMDNHNGKPCQIRLVKGRNIRVLCFNKKTDKVYFDKLYKNK